MIILEQFNLSGICDLIGIPFLLTKFTSQQLKTVATNRHFYCTEPNRLGLRLLSNYQTQRISQGQSQRRWPSTGGAQDYQDLISASLR